MQTQRREDGGEAQSCFSLRHAAQDGTRERLRAGGSLLEYVFESPVAVH